MMLDLHECDRFYFDAEAAGHYIDNRMRIMKALSDAGARILLEFPSVGATETLLMAGTTAVGTTTIDNAAREDNPEEVFAAWQRALAQQGLTAGRFYRIYDPKAAMPIREFAEYLKRWADRVAALHHRPAARPAELRRDRCPEASDQPLLGSAGQPRP